MRLTNMTDYALRLLIFLAQQPQRLCTIAEVARSHAISEAHLMKITHQLALTGWIETVRGKGGGMRLARAPRDIVLGDLVRSIEPDFFMVECFAPGSRCVLTGNCRLTGVIDGALRSFMQHLDGHTLADILPTPAQALASQAVRIQWAAREGRA
ncbi:RrF2 family transcriptional regulator [Caenimonas terrae]|uniref:RrF2 family transcriptional regulator n=1 Tax=Caenimonas terrae TaxID=696074 RepID=A0ABW0NAD3_9BURK